jgi:plasmid stabilization system protein ParE
MREIRILPPVLQDISDAAAWYDEQNYPGLGDRFLDTFYASLLHVQQNGEIYSAAYQDFRKILIRPFPYSVYYRLHSNIWIVTLVIHAARKPDLARALLRDRK